jgi:carbamoyl-phosphate synthase large subunit
VLFRSAIVPRSDDPTFGSVLCQVAAATEANILVPTVAEELSALVEISEALNASGVRTWLPDRRAVHTCLDKWEFANFASEHGIRVPATALGSANGVPGAWVVKPRFGRGSRDVHFVDRHGDLAWYLQQVPEPIVQTRMEGREFTVDALVDRKGRLAGAVPRWRLSVRAGISVKGRTFEDPALVQAVADLLLHLRLCGPSNVQGVMAVDGIPTFIEVNPRFSGGLPLSLAAGADLVGEYVRAVLGQPIRPERLRARPGVTMIRHFEEIFE